MRFFLGHLARLAASIAFLALAPSTPLRAIASVAIFFASFAFAHDAVHGALGIPARHRDLVLAIVAMPMLISGHAMQIMHLRHHARPLAEDDLEGEGAKRPLLSALRIGPSNALALRREAFRVARPRSRRFQLLESGVALVLVALATIFGGALAVHVIVAVALQATMSVWAAHVPHRAPAWVTNAAARLAFTGSPIVLSLAFHERHHELPSLPCRALAAPASHSF